MGAEPLASLGDMAGFSPPLGQTVTRHDVLDIWDKRSHCPDMVKTHADVIALWPSSSILSGDLESQDVKPEAVRKWKARNRIPQAYWLPVVRAAKRRKYGVTLARLATIAARQAANKAA